MRLRARSPLFAPPPPDRPIALLNARLIDPASGADHPGGLITQGRRIKAVGRSFAALSAVSAEDYTVIDCGGHVLAPGLIDLRAALREPGFEHRETLDSGAAAAAAGGITTVCVTPDTDPPIDDPALVEHVLRRAREIAKVRILPYGAATKGLQGGVMSEMALMAEAGAVAFTDADRPIASAGAMRRLLDYAATFDLIVANHPEEPTLSQGAGVTEGELATRLGLPAAPTAAEAIMVARDLRLAALTGARLHVPRVTCAESVALIRRAKAEGLAVTCDASVHHVAMNAVACGGYDTRTKMTPPLRSEEDRQAVLEALGQGVIDAVASDHAPWDREAKRAPFAQAPPGAVALEALLPLMLRQVHAGALSLSAALGRLTIGPALAFGLEGGRLAPGAPADAVLFDPDRPWRFTADRLMSRSRNSPLLNQPMEGRATLTLVGGRIVYRDA